MYFSSKSVAPEALSTYDWRLRLDWDVFQRCMGIAFLAFLAYCICNSPPLASIGFWVSPGFMWLFLSLTIPLAVLKSAALLPSSFLRGKPVLITGCDTGFGLILAKRLHGMGAVIFAGCLSKGSDGAKELAGLDERVHVLELDVTQDEDWEAVYQYVNKETNGELWGLVNNAGWATFGDVEWVSMDTYSKIVDVNVFGVIRGVKKFLPLIRKSRGRVVSIASGLARYTVPTRSPYVLSKWALAGFNNVLRYEMEPFGVKVCLLEPSNFVAATKIFTDRFVKQQADIMWQQMSDEAKSAYGESYFKTRVDIMTSFMTNGITDPNPVIDAYVNALTEVWPQKR